MKIQSDQHIEETALESYAMGSLAAETEFAVEQHLLLCETCRNQVPGSETYIRAIKRGVRTLPPETERARWNFRFAIPAFAMCAVLIAVAVVRFAPRAPDRSPAAVALFAMRGDTQAHAPSGRPLLLEPDLTGLAAAANYRLEMADSSGSLAWHGTLDAARQPARVLVPAQPPGVYFVRISLPSGELLREYTVELRARN